MRTGIVLWLCTILSTLVVWCSCNKKDEVPPVIVITSPNENSMYHVYDTVQVSFQITDEMNLVSASAEIVDMNFIPITPKTAILNFEGTAQVVLADKLINTGDYFVMVTASDGTNDSREFVPIRIVGIPKVRRAIYVATSNGSGVDALWKVDSLFQQSSPWIQPGQDVLKLCVNSEYDQMVLVGNFSTGMKAYNLLSNSLAWSDDVFNVPQTERYQDLLCGEKSFYTTIYDREIRGYTISGALNRNFPTGEYRPELLFAYEDRLMVEENLVGDDRHVLNVFFEPSQTLLWQVNFEMDITGIASLSGDEVMVFGNDNGQARVFHYDIGGNAFWEPRQLPTGKVYNAVGLEGGKVAFTHDDGVYAYTYSPNFLNLLRAGSAYRALGFDVDNGAVITASGTTLEEVSQTGQLVRSVSLADSIVSFDLHYTR